MACGGRWNAHPHGPPPEPCRALRLTYVLACRDTPKLEDTVLDEHMPALPAWTLNEGRTSLHRRFTARNFTAAIAFFDKVRDVAESEGHHPDLHLTDYRTVEVVVSTHSVGGLTMLDLILAAKLDEVDVEYSPKWLREREAA